MPRKKKVETENVAEEPVVVESKVESKPNVCGHVNRHVYNTEGKLQSLSCELPKGHAGDHSALFMKNVPVRVTNEKGITIDTKWRQEEDRAYWNDAAGVDARDIAEQEVDQLSQYQIDILADVLKSSPRLSPAQALAAAKASDKWK